MSDFDREKLTPNFARWEFLSSDTAARRGISNVPRAEHWASLKELSTAILEPAREALGPLRITSGYRAPALNVMVGGSPSSQHMHGEAVDLIPYKVDLSALFMWLHNNADYDQLLWEFSQWVHVSHKRGGPQRHQALIAEKVNGKTVYALLSPERLAAMAEA